jgi:hypothetical protein
VVLGLLTSKGVTPFAMNRPDLLSDDSPQQQETVLQAVAASWVGLQSQHAARLPLTRCWDSFESALNFESKSRTFAFNVLCVPDADDLIKNSVGVSHQFAFNILATLKANQEVAFNMLEGGKRLKTSVETCGILTLRAGKCER